MKKRLSLSFVYVFILTMLPMNILVQDVKALDLFVKKYDVSKGYSYDTNYMSQSISASIADSYGDTSVIIGGDDFSAVENSKVITIKPNGESKNVNINSNKDDFYLGIYKGKAYFYRSNEQWGKPYENPGTITTIDLKDGTEEKLFDIEVPNMKLLPSYIRGSHGKCIQKDGTIILKLNFSNGLLVFRNGQVKVYDTSNVSYEYISGYQSDDKGNIWVVCGEGRELIKIDTDGNITRQNFNVKGYGIFGNLEIDNQGNIWATCTKVYTSPDLHKGIKSSSIDSIYKYGVAKISQDGNSLKTDIYGISSGIDGYSDIRVDKSGEVWVRNGNYFKKFENNHFVKKYEVEGNKVLDFDVVDDDHLVIAEEQGYIYVTNGQPANVPNEKTKVDTENPKASDLTLDTKINNILQAENNNGVGTIIIDGSKINKDGINIINTKVAEPSNNIETRIPISAIKGGKGKLEFKNSDSNIVFPIDALDFTGVLEESYLSINQIITMDPSIYNRTKGVSRIFQFDAAIYDKNGNKIKDIHNFKDNSTVQITLQLTNEDLKGLNPSKLAVFYYNESTNKFERMDGNFSTESNTITFTTTHFSKFVVAEEDSIVASSYLGADSSLGGVLPQTGSMIDGTLLIALALIMIGIGLRLALKKQKTIN